MKYFFHIGYNGSNYRGWQTQVGVVSVQSKLEEIFRKILKEPIICFGCGRTDAGVHADQYFFHIEIPMLLHPDFLFILNKNLPDDIACYEFFEVPESYHARYDVVSRTYDYYIHFYKNPFLTNISTLVIGNDLMYDLMKEAVKIIASGTDFRAYCLTPDKHNHTLCEIKNVQLYHNEDFSQIRFSITANRFLKTMIRLLVGAILDIGSGKLTIEDFENSIKTGIPKEPRFVGYSMGLHLSSVEYPYFYKPVKGAVLLNATNWIEFQ